MYSVRVEDEFAAAHFLADYHGKCERLHGHNYRVRITVSGNTLDPGGMLIDFGILKSSLKESVSRWDHRHLNEMPEFSDGRPSAERIAFELHADMQKRLPSVTVARVEVWETPRNCAIYEPD